MLFFSRTKWPLMTVFLLLEYSLYICAFLCSAEAAAAFAFWWSRKTQDVFHLLFCRDAKILPLFSLYYEAPRTTMAKVNSCEVCTTCTHNVELCYPDDLFTALCHIRLFRSKYSRIGLLIGPHSKTRIQFTFMDCH